MDDKYFEDSPLLTWLDVERRIKYATHNFTEMPNFIHNFDCYSDGLDIECSNVVAATDWIATTFGLDYDSAENSLIFEIEYTLYPISFIEVKGDSFSKTTFPLWKHVLYSPVLRSVELRKIEKPIYAFHSFKGGVGRTTSLITFVSALIQSTKSNQNTKILIIDSDLEAPGVSLWLDKANKPKVSYLNFLELIHYPPKDLDSSIDYVVKELKKSSINTEGVNKELFILPASLRLDDVMDMNISTEHIVSDSNNPFKLTEMIDVVAQHLDVDAVFVDLRAGISEISSPLLLDPRVEKFYVSTLASQSIYGISNIIKKVTQFNKLNGLSASGSNIILGPLNQQLRESKDYQESLTSLIDSFSTVDDGEKCFDLYEVDFDPNLMALRDLKHAMESVKTSSLFKKAIDWSYAIENESDIKVTTDRTGDLNKLHEFCKKIQFAENISSSEMLITDPIRNLGKHFQGELPNIISIGAKGSGKTFTYTQVLFCKSWAVFLDKLGLTQQSPFDNVTVDIHPCLWSKNLNSQIIDVILNQRESVFSSETVLSEIVQAKLTNDDIDWGIFWEKEIIADLGLSQKVNNFKELNDYLTGESAAKIILFDGIEDLFDNLSNDNQVVALKALLEVPNRLQLIRNRKIGVLIFVREDYISQVISQNISQFVERYSPFRLVWTPETFLRLIYWICSRSEIIDALPELVDNLSLEELLRNLEKLWGKKLGKNNSKEAMSARWVFAALCDLNGRLQARDIVRFLKFAANEAKSANTDSWGDRILPPEPMRRTLNLCSEEKVNEATQEIAPLKKWVNSLIDVPGDAKKSPFDPSKLGLDSETLNSLKSLGIIFEDVDAKDKSERFYLPEIYRNGLNFTQSAAGRPRVQAFLKKNLGGMPF